MQNNQILGYQAGSSFVHHLNATTKLLFFILVSIACMVTYDTRFLLAICILSFLSLKIAHIRWHQISFIIKLIAIFAVINLLAVYLFQPSYGSHLYGTQHVFLDMGYFTITEEELFYLFNLILKYLCSVPLAIIFLLTTNPSQFASSLNKIGLSYRIAYAVSLALRYIPTVQADFRAISDAQQARGNELSKKAKLTKRIKGTLNIVIPLIFSSLNRIDTISTAMQLRRFGSKRRRSWYIYQPFKKRDYCVLGLALFLIILTIILWNVDGGRFYNPFK